MRATLTFLVVLFTSLFLMQCTKTPTSNMLNEDMISEVIDLELEITDLEDEAKLDESACEKVEKFQKALGLLNRIIRYANRLVSELDDESKMNDLMDIKRLRNKSKRLAEQEKFYKAFKELKESRIKAVALIELITGENYSLRKQKRYYKKLQKRKENVCAKIKEAKLVLESLDSVPIELTELMENAINDFETACVALGKWRLDKANKYFIRARRKANRVLHTINPPPV